MFKDFRGYLKILFEASVLIVVFIVIFVCLLYLVYLTVQGISHIL
jgi:hypothetical protein